jgi:hypothetical protein
MKRNILGRIFSTAFLLSFAAVMSAQDEGSCSNASLAGQWRYTVTGTVMLPTGAAPMAVVGKAGFDDPGNFSGWQTSSVGGRISTPEIVNGTSTVKSDCTVPFTANTYDRSGNLLRKAIWGALIDDNATEYHGIATSLTLPEATGRTGDHRR